VRIIDKGSGPPLVLIPRLEGRWEYMSEAIAALARTFRVISFPLLGEPDADAPFDPALGLDAFVQQLGAAIDQAGVDRAVICGVSFGGVVAVRFAAAYPERTTALIIATTPGPQFHLSRRHAIYSRLPRVFAPIFLSEAMRRLLPELAAAIPDRGERLRFAWAQIRKFPRTPTSLRRMAKRARAIAELDLTDECARITAPTLVITGESSLDHVVPSTGTPAYARLIPGARHVVLERTGHQGVMTRPDAFAALIDAFVREKGSCGSHAA
jgi:3-oxoadipate enol-lactonase